MEKQTIDLQYFIENWKEKIKFSIKFTNQKFRLQWLYTCKTGVKLGHLIEFKPEDPDQHEFFEIACENVAETIFAVCFQNHPLYNFMQRSALKSIENYLLQSLPENWEGFRYFGPQGEKHHAAQHPRFLESPAIQFQSSDYPARFEGRVPLLAVATKEIAPDPGHSFTYAKDAYIRAGEIFICYTNSYGAVLAILPNGEEIGARPDEFEVIEYFSGDRAALLEVN